MIYSVYVCACGYRMFNVDDKRGAKRWEIKALKRYAKEQNCHFAVGLTKCPSCRRETGRAETPIVVAAADEGAHDRAVRATRDLLGQ